MPRPTYNQPPTETGVALDESKGTANNIVKIEDRIVALFD